jgi:hypothetical protein
MDDLPSKYISIPSGILNTGCGVAGSVLGIRELSDRYPLELQDNDWSNR